ncbi:MAG: 2-oxo acid dehydrogenase subunit E2 [Planctomycetes bacterium]|nr:2-oxo acid dehydrogenase subunit E2 [Planctomycetota bacterium]
MAYEFKLPDLGEGVHEGQIVRWCVAEGDHVAEDQPLMEVETDKAAVEIPSPYTGIVSKIHASEQQIVYVGDVMVTFEGASETTAAKEPITAASSKQAVSNGEIESRGKSSPIEGGRRKPASPAVRKLARVKGIDLDSIEGTGPGGRVTREDVERAAQGDVSIASATPTPAAPADTTTIVRVTQITSPPALLTTDLIGTPGNDDHGAIVRQPISQARKTIAQMMSHSMATIPHVTDSDDADVTELDKFRRGYSLPDIPGVPQAQQKITMLAFIVRAVVKALQLHPIFNASYDEQAQEIIYKRYYNIAIGVQTQRGLIAPVIREADRLTISQLSDAIATISENARSATFAVNDMRGGTFTISNAGAMGGSRYSTPIITPPQVAVIAVGKTRWQPWVVEGEIVPRLIMPVSCSFDHRIIDGAQEIQFARQIIGDLENPARLLL